MLKVGFDLPLEHITQKCSLLATTGSGKSVGIASVMEEYCKNDLPFVMIDVDDAHWGIRTKYDVLIIGGDYCDIEIGPKDGKDTAQYILDNDVKWVIVSVANFSDEEAQLFFYDLGTYFFENNKKRPRHIFIEEAELFVPQYGGGESRLSRKICNKLMKRGRARGLGITLISQRPSDVDKKTLSQSQCTMLMHLEEPNDLKAIRYLIHDKDLANDLVNYKKGDVLVYSPSWLEKKDKCRFRMRETFHAGQTPKYGEPIIEPDLIPIHFKPFNDEIDLENEEPVMNNPFLTPKAQACGIIAGAVLGAVLFILTSSSLSFP